SLRATSNRHASGSSPTNGPTTSNVSACSTVSAATDLFTSASPNTPPLTPPATPERQQSRTTPAASSRLPVTFQQNGSADALIADRREDDDEEPERETAHQGERHRRQDERDV